MMRKVLADCLLLALVLGMPLAGILATVHMGSFSLLTLLPTIVCGGIFFMRYAMRGEFFFEQWLHDCPVISVPIVMFLLCGTMFCEVRIILSAQEHQLNIPILIDQEEQELNKFWE